MPVIQASNTTRQQSVTDIIASVALEQAALAHILNAEGEKIQKALEPCASFEVSSESRLKEYDFVYLGVLPYLGLAIGDIETAIIQLTDSISGINILTYCFDVETGLKYGDHYAPTILQESTDISEVNANRVRSILLNAFPYISVATIAARSSIPTLTQQEAITAAQLAIWKLTNNYSVAITHPNVLALYNWYLNLTPTEIIIDPAQIDLTVESVFSEIGCGVAFSFDATGVNADGTQVALSYAFSKDIVAEYGAIVHESVSGGITTVEVTHLPQGAAFTITVTGAQTLPLDGYRYLDAQDLTGLFAQTEEMRAQCDYLCNGTCHFDVLRVNASVNSMVDTITSLEKILQAKLALFGDCLCGEESSVAQS